MSMEAEHGTVKRYAAGCRCEMCKTAKMMQNRKYNERRRAAKTGEARKAVAVCGDCLHFDENWRTGPDGAGCAAWNDTVRADSPFAPHCPRRA